ncbi:DUF6153 family protein [Nocardioides KLBMP 9356]|uniref:DUF6153 family protein n=1 Tax=Nocardioides potassii TaxID=2911371 RepID=A0ABS9HH90_9ACTN|nr:DUF6153 family protein [Nocardioides potassii]MCF6379929.1 DUF6153 family protein [Nocardioides potassii]
MNRTWWAMAAALAILAMHGLATHTSSHGSAPAVVAVTDAGPAHTATLADQADHAMSSATSLTGSATHSQSGDDGAVLSLCLVVLATAAVLLLRAVRPRSGLLAVLPPAVAVPAAPVVVRLHAPPDLHALSVLRC